MGEVPILDTDVANSCQQGSVFAWMKYHFHAEKLIVERKLNKQTKKDWKICRDSHGTPWDALSQTQCCAFKGPVSRKAWASPL